MLSDVAVVRRSVYFSGRLAEGVLLAVADDGRARGYLRHHFRRVGARSVKLLMSREQETIRLDACLPICLGPYPGTYPPAWFVASTAGTQRRSRDRAGTNGALLQPARCTCFDLPNAL
eukprot:3912384-Pleurochrysis_carterae.AAC.1